MSTPISLQTYINENEYNRDDTVCDTKLTNSLFYL